MKSFISKVDLEVVKGAMKGMIMPPPELRAVLRANRRLKIRYNQLVQDLNTTEVKPHCEFMNTIAPTAKKSAG